MHSLCVSTIYIRPAVCIEFRYVCTRPAVCIASVYFGEWALYGIKPVPTNANDTRTRNWYRKPVPENLYQFSAGGCVIRIGIDFFWYQNLVRSRAVFYSVPKTGTGFLVPVFGTGFWCVCHGHNSVQSLA